MQIETVGKYQLHLIALEAPEPGKWDPFVSILQFNDAAQDFRCVVEKYHASETLYATYDEAIEQARRVGTALVEQRSGS